MSSTTHHPEDRGAAFTGLIIGVIALTVLVFGIVKFTNAQLASHEKPAAAASK